MNPLDHLKSNLHTIEAQISLRFNDPNLLMLAFIHPSFVNENRSFIQEDNQRLEYLGDAVLNLIAADFLYEHLPEKAEGDLSHLRSMLVDAKACQGYVEKLGIAKWMLTSKGEKSQIHRGRASLMADLFESLVGALYLDGGLEKARQFIFMHFADEIDQTIQNPPRNWKAELQDYAQKKYNKPPEYVVIEEEGPDHAKIFCVKAIIGDVEALGSGNSKKVAQASAAKNAMEMIEDGQG